MKIKLLFSIVIWIFVVCELHGIEVGKTYDILKATQLKSGPEVSAPRIINQQASDITGEVHYLEIDKTTTVKVLQVNAEWAKIQVTEPDWLSDTHIGWVPTAVIKEGQSTRKLNGWVAHTCLVYNQKSLQSKPVGYLAKPASIGVIDDGSGWLKLIHAPVRDNETKKFVSEMKIIKGDYFIETKNFTTISPF